VTVEVGEGGSLSVADSGPGIPMQNRPCLFDRFWRGPSSRSGGAGLGLAIAMEIVRAHRASITVNDHAPRGVRFDLRFNP
jgi:signal transduction histidine kinase